MPVGANSSPTFECLKPSGLSVSVWVLAEDQAGEILVGTEAGLYRMSTSPSSVFTSIPLGSPSSGIWAIERDHSGNLWIAAKNRVHRLHANKPSVHLTRRDGLPSEEVLSLQISPDGDIWVGTSEGLCRINPSTDPPSVEQVIQYREGLPSVAVAALHFGVQGTLGVGTRAGLAEALRDRHGRITSFRAYSQEHGLSHGDICHMEDDLAGNLWIATQSGGAMKLTRGGFSSYGIPEGLGSPQVVAMVETRAKQICAITKKPGKLYFNLLEGGVFRAVPVPVDASYYSALCQTPSRYTSRVDRHH